MKRENGIHTYAQAAIFRAKVSLLQLRRGIFNLADGKNPRLGFAAQLADAPVIAESKTALWTESSRAEQSLLAGKVHNLRLAVKKLNGLEIPASRTFSFWQAVGRASRRNGYVAGRELREGCIIPSVGGGLCQLSNALYDAALKANFEIVERHAHSQIVAGSLAEQGRDATVFWNYVDLRFKSPNAFRIEVRLDKDSLRVRFKSAERKNNFVQISKNGEGKNPESQIQNPQSCATCGEESCFRSLKPDANLNFGRAAFLVDEFAPELDEYVNRNRTAKDFLFVPLDGKRFRKANYAWTTSGFARTTQSLLVTLERSYKSRRLAAQGAARQLNLLAMSEKLAADYARRLAYDQTHVVVQQNLLPFLWREGVLGGRTFDVLMTALPMENLQQRLDVAAALHAESKTLGDFRADRSLVEAETEALRHAERIVTAHTAIADLFADRAEILDWKMPAPKTFDKKPNGKFTVVYPAATVGRKGCYELREAIKDLDVKLITLGAMLEGEDFWRGVDWEKGADDWLERADLIALPAFVEHRPRRLLQAAANKIPVVASLDCGLKNTAGVTNVAAGSVAELRGAIIAQGDFYRNA